MAQAALAFVAATDTPLAGALPGHAPNDVDAFEALGFAIGRDHARHGLTPPAGELHAGHPVREGWEDGLRQFRRRTREATPAVRHWLALRLGAWRRGEPVEGQLVTPNLVAQLMADRCPVSGVLLSALAGDDGEAVIERLNPAAAWAAGNLVMLSRRVQAARAGRDWRACRAAADRIERGECEAIDGLSGAEWLRLAVLASFATPLSHDEAASLPLVVLPPNRVRVLNPVQALQVMLTLPYAGTTALPRSAALAALLPAASRQAFHVFVTTLLARRVAAGAHWDAEAMRQAMTQAWAEPLLLRRWQRLVLPLGAGEAERTVRLAAERGLAGDGWRMLEPALAVDGWQLPATPRPLPAPSRAPAAAERRGGEAVAALRPERRRLRPASVAPLAPTLPGRRGSAAHRVE